MSGSGATVFGLFDSADAASMARSAIQAAQPSWWCVDTTLAGSASMG
jgi:4-diphosphocytidyl-2-C-methyl-D-erythritol kinase